MKIIVILLLVLITLRLDSQNLTVPRAIEYTSINMRQLNVDSFLVQNEFNIKEYIKRNTIASKLLCPKKYTANDFFNKAKLWGDVDEYYDSKYRKWRTSYSKMLVSNEQYRINTFLSINPYDLPCYSFKKLSSKYSSLSFVDTIFPDYIFLWVNRSNSFAVKCKYWDNVNSTAKNLLNFYDSSGNCLQGDCRIGSNGFFDNEFITAISINPSKPNIIFSEEICNSDTNWRFIFQEIMGNPKLDKALIENKIAYYLQLYLHEYINTQPNFFNLKVSFLKSKKNIYTFLISDLCCMEKELVTKIEDLGNMKRLSTEIIVKVNSKNGSIISLNKYKK